MKILGKTENGFVVDMHFNELDQLTGHYYNSYKYRIGQELRIDQLFNQLEALRDQDEKVKKIAHSLKTAAGMLEKIDPIFQVRMTDNDGK